MGTKIRTTHIIRSTGILMAAFLANKILAIGRQIIIAQTFGTGSQYDAFVAAFRLPDILFMLISGGALGTAFIPILSQRLTLKTPNDPDGWQLASSVLNTLLVVVMGISVLLAIFARPLVQWLVAPGFSMETQILTANLMRLTLISTIIFSASSLAGAVLHARQHFLLPAIAPLIYNLGIMFGAVFLAPTLGVYGLIFGAILGAAGHLLIQVPGLIRHGIKYQPILDWQDQDLWHVGKLMGPRVLNIVVIQINFVVMFNLASFLGEGSVSALDYGWDLMQMPQTIIGSAIGIVLFPTLSELAARGDIARLRQTMAQTLRIMLTLAIPAMVGLIVLGRPLIRVMFERGQFGPDSTAAVYQSLQFWALGLIAHSVLEVVNRVFYAQKDTITPFLSSVVSMVINLGLALALYQSLRAGGLALSNGVAVTIEVLIMLVIAHRRMAGVEAGSMLNTLGRTLLAAGAMGAAVLAFITLFPTLSPIFVAAGGGILGLAVYIGVGLLLRVEEIWFMPRLAGRYMKL
jgi:putative peptidoglycan lipid II flippase